MQNQFFDQPILNSPYSYPTQHWELDTSGQPTQKIIPTRRRAEFITPIPKPKKRKKNKTETQHEIVFDEGKGLSTEEQQYDPTSIINQIRQQVEHWRAIANPNDWNVTPETARLLQHWRHHKFNSFRHWLITVAGTSPISMRSKQKLRRRLSRSSMRCLRRGSLRGRSQFRKFHPSVGSALMRSSS